MKFLSLKSSKHELSFVFASMTVWGESRLTVWERNFSCHIICNESIKYEFHQWNFSFLRPQNTKIGLQEIKDYSLQKKVSILVCNRNFKKVHAYCKKYFQQHSLRSSFVWSQYTWTFWLLQYQAGKRSKVIVWQRHIAQITFCKGSFRNVSTKCKKLFSTASVKFSFSEGLRILRFFHFW